MKKLILTTSLLLCFFFMFSFTVKAQETPSPSKDFQDFKRPLNAPLVRETIMEKRENIQEIRKDMRQNIVDQKKELREKMITGQQNMKDIRKENTTERCKNVTGRISRITAASQMGLGGRVKVFKTISERFKKLSANLAEKDVNVTTFNTVLTTLDSKIQKLEDDYKVFTDKLEGTKQYECGNSEGAFKIAREEAAPAFEQIQKDKEDIEKYLKTEVRAALSALRSNFPTKAIETTGIPQTEVPGQ